VRRLVISDAMRSLGRRTRAGAHHATGPVDTLQALDLSNGANPADWLAAAPQHFEGEVKASPEE